MSIVGTLRQFLAPTSQASIEKCLSKISLDPDHDSIRLSTLTSMIDGASSQTVTAAVKSVCDEENDQTLTEKRQYLVKRACNKLGRKGLAAEVDQIQRRET